MLIPIILIIAGIILLVLILALLTKKGYTVQREILIAAPAQTVYNYLKLLKNQDHFNKWVMMDPAMKKEFKGTDGTVGFIYAWNGNKKAGEGEQEIKALVDGKRIDSEVRFVRPMPGVAQVNLLIEAMSGNQAKVTWSNASAMKYPMNILVRMIEKMLAKDMDASLLTLKTILEK